VDDNTYEKNEHFFVKLGKLSHADAQLNGERATSKVTIVSDDPEPPVLNMRETEGNTLSKLSATYDILESAGHVNVAVVRTGDHSKRCSCEYATKGGTATPGADYEETEGTLVFDPGQTVKYIEVKIVDNDEFEHNEEVPFPSFLFSLSLLFTSKICTLTVYGYHPRSGGRHTGNHRHCCGDHHQR
jgi:solute carrier family 8 (sodium/calcium exchanger)